jgi:hypothetical protein
MFPKSSASPCILTLILSLFFLIYTINLKRIKFKTYIKNRRNSSKFKTFRSYQTLWLIESLMLRNRPTFHIQTTLAFIMTTILKT